MEATPIVVDSLVYLAASDGIYAINGVTADRIWKFPAVHPTNCGVSYWPGDAKSPARIVASSGNKMFALNAKTGEIIRLEESLGQMFNRAATVTFVA